MSDWGRDRVPDDFDARLRRALTAEAETVQPSGDGLERVRARTARPATPWWRPALLAVAAVAAVALVAGVLGTTVLADDDVVATAPTPTTAPTADPATERPSDPPSDPPTGVATGPATGEAAGPASGVATGEATPPPEPAAAPTGQPTGQPAGQPTGGSDAAPTGRPGAGPTATPAPTRPAGTGRPTEVFVYYLADTGRDLRLYRELRTVPDAGGKVATAVTEMLRGDPLDPDYSSVWPRGSRLLGYSVQGTTATVDLSAEALTAGAGAVAEERSVQQLVYTVTANDPDVRSVRLLVDGAEVEELWGHGFGDQPVSRAPMLDVLGHVWIIDPAQGAAVTSPVSVRVYGTAYEGNVVLKVFPGAGSAGGEEVESTFVTTAQGEFAEAATTIDLPPGDYTVRAYTESGEDYETGEWDSKRFTVR